MQPLHLTFACRVYWSRRALSTGRSWKPQVVSNPNNPNKAVADDSDPRKLRPMTRMGMLAWDYQQQVQESGIPQRGDLSAWEALANHKIRDSMEKGEFENLQGKGKPLKDIGMGHSSDADALGNKILKNNNLMPHWIQRKQEINNRTQAVRASIREAVAETAAPRRRKQEVEIKKEITQINRLIDDYNLSAPALSQQRVRLRWEKEMAKVQQGPIKRK